MTDIARIPSDPVQADASGLAAIIERFALNPSIDVDKLEKIIALQERILRYNAKAAFETDYSQMQAEIPQIDEHGRIKKRDGSTQSTYAKLEDIVAAITPVLVQHGFSIRYRTEYPKDKTIRTVGILSHKGGHSEETYFDAEEDTSDFRSKIQSQGSTRSYGRRYALFDLLNITTRGVDNDGQRPPVGPQPAQRKSQAPAPIQAVVVDLPANVQDITPSGAGEQGVLITVDQREQGTVLTLDTGFRCVTADPEVITTARSACATRQRVELLTRPAQNPKYAPRLVELTFVRTGEFA